MDETYARSTAFGGQVVPGSMVSAVAIGLGSLDVPAPATAGMVGMTWRFLKPVRPGDSLHTTWRLNRKRPVENPAVGLCFWQVEVLNQHGDVVATGEVGRLVQRRERKGRAVEADAPGAPAPDVAEPAARRRPRRGRGGEREARAAAEPVVADAPEPAPADTPPARRRRRRGGRGGRGGNGAAVEPSATESAPPPAPVETSPAPPSRTSSRSTSAEGRGLRGVLRRLRGGGAEG